MQKNKFCTIPSKALIYEDSITMTQSTIYKNKDDNEFKKNKNIKKLKESFYIKDFKDKDFNYSKISNDSLCIKYYILSKKILSKNTDIKRVNIDLTNINNIIYNKKCRITARYNDYKIYNNNKVEYITKYYKYYESTKIIPKKEAYFKHLMQFIERPVYMNFIFNKISKKIGLDKLIIYRKINYPKKLNKKINNNNNTNNNILSDNNIIFNSDVIETIENCSTSITQRKNKDQIKKSGNKSIKYEHETSIISEIKINNCNNNKKNDNNISCIDNSLLIIMKDLSISQNKINAYLCNHNSNYKNLYNKIKEKTKVNNNINKNYLKNKNTFKDLKDKNSKTIDEKEKNYMNNKKQVIIKRLKNKDFYQKILSKKQRSNIESNQEQNKLIDNEINHNSVSIGKKINNIKILPFNSNAVNSQIINKNSSCNDKNCYMSSFVRNKNSKIKNLKKKFNTNKIIFNKYNNNKLCNHFNSISKEKNKNTNLVKFLNNNKIIYDLNDKGIKNRIYKFMGIKKQKNYSMKKDINMQKILNESPMWPKDLSCLNVNEEKRKYQTINIVKSISISNNQFFNSKKEFKKKECE